MWAPKLDRVLQQNPFHTPLLMQQIFIFLLSCELVLPIMIQFQTLTVKC